MGKRQRKSEERHSRKRESDNGHERFDAGDTSSNPEGNWEGTEHGSGWHRDRPGYRAGEHWPTEGEYSGLGNFGPAFSPGWARSFPSADNAGTSGPHRGRGPRGYERSDDRLYEEVCERLTQHGRLDARQIEVRCAHGEVTLEGTVQDRYSKRLAEEIAESARGVRDVHNRLRVELSPGAEAGPAPGTEGPAQAW